MRSPGIFRAGEWAERCRESLSSPGVGWVSWWDTLRRGCNRQPVLPPECVGHQLVARQPEPNQRLAVVNAPFTAEAHRLRQWHPVQLVNLARIGRVVAGRWPQFGGEVDVERLIREARRGIFLREQPQP